MTPEVELSAAQRRQFESVETSLAHVGAARADTGAGGGRDRKRRTAQGA